jgi:hypothetical protein
LSESLFLFDLLLDLLSDLDLLSERLLDFLLERLLDLRLDLLFLLRLKLRTAFEIYSLLDEERLL